MPQTDEQEKVKPAEQQVYSFTCQGCGCKVIGSCSRCAADAHQRDRDFSYNVFGVR